MSRIAKVCLALLSVAAILGIVIRIQDLIRKDPLARFLVPPTSIGIQLQGVSVKHYTRSTLTGTAQVETVDVLQDHQNMDFYRVTDGVFHTPKGVLRFTGNRANYNALTGQINVTAGGHATAKNLDASAPAFLYDQNTATLSVPGKVQGTYGGGKFFAIGLVYHGTTNNFSITNVDWTGSFALNDADLLQTPSDHQKATSDQSGRSKWHISGQLEVMNGMDYYTDMRADDGDILVKAPHGERDEKTDVLNLTGPVYYFSEKANLVCDKAVIYRKEKRAVLSGNVHMLVKPKDQEKLEVTEIPPFNPPVPAAIADKRPPAPQTAESQQEKDLDDELTSSKTARKYPAHVRADQIEYWYAKGSRQAIITGSPQCYQDFPGNRWRRVATHEAFYDGEKDELVLKSSDGQKDTRLLDSIGDDLIATEFTVSTKEDEPDRYKGKDVDGVYATDNEDLKDIPNGGQGSDNTKGNGPKSPGGPGPGPIPANPKPQTSPGTPAQPTTPSTGH